MKHYAEVLLPLALPGTFTSQVPPELVAQMQPGIRVIVQFGKRKLYTALVRSIHHNEPRDFQPKDILEVEDQQPIVFPQQLEFWEWIARYYMCTPGEVMTAALPAGLKLESEMAVMRNQKQTVQEANLSDAEYLVIEALENQSSLSIREISEITELKNPMALIKNLLGKRYIILREELKEQYAPRVLRMVRMAAKFDEKQLSEIFPQLEKAPRQRDLLLEFFRLKGNQKPLTAARLLKNTGATDSSLKGLEKRGILEIYYDQPESEKTEADNDQLKNLNPEQLSALETLRREWKDKPVCLLHGVTSSGKTEVYAQLIKEMLDEGGQVLYLVPEIALTTQLIQRLRVHFGDQVRVYHSRYSNRERIETWLELAENPDCSRLIIGARSSLFLPFGKLRMVIVDEEHETSFKQQDPAPRYHARDAAIVLAGRFKAPTLLGSATPSLESYQNAREGKYGMAQLFKRFGDLPQPEITCVDLKESRRKKKMVGPFSESLQKAIEANLQEQRQVILFQNRRGFTPFLQCDSCGEVVQCRHCDISLTYHKKVDLLRCHYCGYTRQIPTHCPACKSPELKSLGFGTEKLEDDLRLMYPKAVVQRLDLDTTRRKNAYQNIINAFEAGQTDIMVGTQMVTKGLDFENVGLVGILNADSLLNFPDFRSHERAFQLLAQVAGRAGRKGKRGEVLIQTAQPYHQVIRRVMDYQYQEFFEEEYYERKSYQYPPYYRLIKITLKHRDRGHLESRAGLVGKMLRDIFGQRVLGPEFPLTARLRNLYQMEIMLKLEPKASPSKAKRILHEAMVKFEKEHPRQRPQIIYNVDPQ